MSCMRLCVHQEEYLYLDPPNHRLLETHLPLCPSCPFFDRLRQGLQLRRARGLRQRWVGASSFLFCFGLVCSVFVPCLLLFSSALKTLPLHCTGLGWRLWVQFACTGMAHATIDREMLSVCLLSVCTLIDIDNNICALGRCGWRQLIGTTIDSHVKLRRGWHVRPRVR